MTGDNEISREEAEAILSGTLGSSTAGDLVGVLEEIRREADLDQSAFIATFTRIAAAEAATSVVAPVISSRPALAASALVLVPMRRVAATATSVMLIVASLTGVAIAADHSGPGDVLYGLDRALEAVGIGSGGNTERLQEVKALIDSGEIKDGLSHANETLELTPANNAARDAIADATTRLEEARETAASGAGDEVTSLLNYLANNPQDLDPEYVAFLAREIAPDIDTPAPDTPPWEPPADLPGSNTGADNRSDNPSTSRPSKP
jgi:hypothetical protein